MNKINEKKEYTNRKAYIWNACATLLDAVQSPILLLIITWIVGLDYAGMFSIGYSFACQLLIVGKYNVRNFQVTDQRREYSFGDYLLARIITTGVMVIMMVIYVAYGSVQKDYSAEKVIIIILIVFCKLVDSIEDVFGGMYQQNNRLDVAARCMTLRMFLWLCLMICMIIFSKNLIFALAISLCVNVFVCIVLISKTIGLFDVRMGLGSRNKALKMLRACFPLFFGAFCSMYTVNSPKYAIDGVLSDEMQAIYGIISLPALAIYVFTSAVFQTQVFKMARCWVENRIYELKKIVAGQILILLSISFFAGIFCFFLGIPILSLLYQVDLYSYKLEFMLLLSGGVCLGLSALLSTVLVVMRKQILVFAGYGVVALIAFFTYSRIALQFGILGCSCYYVLLMFFEMVLFTVLVIKAERGLIEHEKSNKEISA